MKYVNQKFKFKMDIPDNWSITENAGHLVFGNVNYGNSKNCKFYLDVFTDETATPADTVKTLSNEQKAERLQYIKNLAATEFPDGQFGFDSGSFTNNQPFIRGLVETKNSRGTSILIIYKQCDYNFIFITNDLSDNSYIHEVQFLEMIQSISFL